MISRNLFAGFGILRRVPPWNWRRSDKVEKSFNKISLRAVGEVASKLLLSDKT